MPLKAKTASMLVITLISISTSIFRVNETKLKYKKDIDNIINKKIDCLVALILSAIIPAVIAHIGLKYERLLIVAADFSLL